jgi:hypothetical protein
MANSVLDKFRNQVANPTRGCGETYFSVMVTGIVTGVDPLQPYARPDLCAQQLLRVAQFPHAGDLIIVSTLYPAEQVAAFEELVGSHGGLGGEQTTAFLVHPADMHMPETTNSTGVFPVLNARRGQLDEREASI